MAKEAYVWDGEELKLNLDLDEIIQFLRSDKETNFHLFGKNGYKIGDIEFEYFSIIRSTISGENLEYFSSDILINNPNKKERIDECMNCICLTHENFLNYVLFRLNERGIYGKYIKGSFAGINLGNYRSLFVSANNAGFVGNVYRLNNDITIEKAELVKDELTLAGRVTGLMFNIFNDIYIKRKEIPLISEIKYAKLEKRSDCEFYRDGTQSEFERCLAEEADKLLIPWVEHLKSKFPIRN